MENKETVLVEYQKTVIVPVFAEQKLIVHYSMKHKKNGYENNYNVVCEIRGIKTLDLQLSVYDVGPSDPSEDTNPETLTKEGAEELFEEQIQ